MEGAEINKSLLALKVRLGSVNDFLNIERDIRKVLIIPEYLFHMSPYIFRGSDLTIS